MNGMDSDSNYVIDSSLSFVVNLSTKLLLSGTPLKNW